MKCVYNPGREATTVCASCRQPLCDECAMEVGDGTMRCMKCTISSTLLQIEQKREEEVEAKKVEVEAKKVKVEAKKVEEKAKKKKIGLLRPLVLISIGLVLAAIELILLANYSRHDVPQFVPLQTPSAFVIIVKEAISNYSRDHGGEVPKGLHELLGKYLAPERVKSSDLAELVYVRKTPATYELKPKRMEIDTVPVIIFTEESFKLGELP